MRSLHHTPGTRRITWQTTIYVVLVLLAAAFPISQLLIGHHYISIDKTHASQFLIANSIVSCYIVVLGLWKVSKRCVGLYKCCLKLFFIPLLVAICIGFGLLADFHSIGCLHPFVASYTSQVGMMPLNHTSVILNYDLC